MNVTSAVQKRDDSPGALVARYRDDFATVLPASIRAETFVRLAQGVLRRDEKLAQAATESPQSLLVALLDAARLGHEPGTPDYYLTPRKNKAGRYEVLGIEGYRGVIQRIFNSGLVASVVAEIVCAGDKFDYTPGLHERPIHEVDWFGERGKTIGAYAYAVTTSGATSKVVVVGPREIKRAKQASASAGSSYSPWNTDYDAMVRKTAVHRLEPFVAKSATAYTSQLEQNAAAEQLAEREALPPVEPPAPSLVNAETGEVIEAELVDEPAEVADPSDEADPWSKDAAG